MPFVKLDTGILDSSLWSEPAQTCKCWITLLAMADAAGFVSSTAPGIARRANLGLADTEKALEIFESPDAHSRSLNAEGRRIKRVDGGYQIVNYDKYRERDYTAAERQKRWRERQKQTSNGVTTVTHNVISRKQKQSTEAEEEKKKPSKDGFLIPDVLISIPNFTNEWLAFKQMRLAKRAKLTPRAAEIILNRLSEKPEKALVALSRCIEKNWTSFEWDWLEQSVNGRVVKVDPNQERLDAEYNRILKERAERKRNAQQETC